MVHWNREGRKSEPMQRHRLASALQSVIVRWSKVTHILHIQNFSFFFTDGAYKLYKNLHHVKISRCYSTQL